LLHRVLTRIGYDYLNKQVRERRLQEKQEQYLQVSEREIVSNEQEVMRQLDQEEVRGWLDQLPERDRKLLMLRYSGYSYAEIADKLQVGQPLVGTLLNRATTKLKRYAEARAQS
jgi:RNA polymerase sigma factor (sigma-70 family)